MQCNARAGKLWLGMALVPQAASEHSACISVPAPQDIYFLLEDPVPCTLVSLTQ